MRYQQFFSPCLSLLLSLLLITACGGSSDPAGPGAGDNPPGAPQAVQSITVEPANGGAVVSWSAVNNASRYTVFASTQASDTTNALQVPATEQPVTIGGLSNDTVYYISVRAENDSGYAPRSAEQVVMPSAAGVSSQGWSVQTLINTPYDFFGQDNYLGGVAINDAGVAAATWIFAASTDGSNFVLVNHSTGGDWGSEKILALGDNSQPQVSITPDGVIVAAWVSHYLDSNNFRIGSTIMSRRFENGVWTEAQSITDIAQGAGDYAGAIALSADGLGNVVASWWQNQSTMWTNRYDGSDWGQPVQIGSSVRTLGPPAIATNSSDKAIVTWLQATEPFDPGQSAGGPDRRTLYASRFDGTNWITTRVGHTDLAGFDGAQRARIDMNAAGSAVVVWQQTRDNTSGDGFRIDAVRYNAALDQWSTPESVTARDWQVSWPDVAIDNNGNAIATWVPTDLADNSSRRVLEAALFDAGRGSWSSPVVVNEDDGTTEPDPLFVEMQPDGDVFAVWDQPGGVFWRRYDWVTQAWNPIERIGNYNANGMAMAMSSNNNALVVTNPLVVRNNRFEHAVFALQYRP